MLTDLGTKVGLIDICEPKEVASEIEEKHGKGGAISIACDVCNAVDVDKSFGPGHGGARQALRVRTHQQRTEEAYQSTALRCSRTTQRDCKTSLIGSYKCQCQGLRGINNRHNKSDIIDFLQILIDFGADLKESGGGVIVNLREDATNINIVNYLLDQGIDPNSINDLGQTSLHRILNLWQSEAEGEGYVKVLELLLNYRVDIDAIDRNWESASSTCVLVTAGTESMQGVPSRPWC
ncbi:hypothetical protein F5884DRAFT_756888 [Xylogone sp. PMI_703]|nr:hypothetical protein F5884DRAFT_756888 [Xylogone sp. PMI_703]